MVENIRIVSKHKNLLKIHQINSFLILSYHLQEKGFFFFISDSLVHSLDNFAKMTEFQMLGFNFLHKILNIQVFRLYVILNSAHDVCCFLIKFNFVFILFSFAKLLAKHGMSK